ncbi:MAG: hypothetical protein J2P19_21860, partial [Pseudonocardia sp.]|nr:hypothetical protein [Pseudonocardia sp.]
MVLTVAASLAGCGAGGTTAPAAGPGAYQGTLWAQRPVVRLAFDVAADLRSVTGQESVVFTPDAPTCEMVFRAHPNNPTMAGTGSSLTLTSATVNGTPVQPQVQPAGAPPGAPGTLIDLPLAPCPHPGQSVRAELGFNLALGVNADERVGTSPDTQTAWFGTAFPLLSWVRGQGWTRDPAVAMNGETAVSEEFQLADLSVTAPNGDQVVGVGRQGPTTPGARPGSTVHRFSADSVRDVTVSVGRYDLAEQDVDGVRVHLGTPTSGTRAPSARWLNELSHAIDTLGQHFGPFPYTDLWASITPGQSDGTEYPGALQFGDEKQSDLQALVAHEVSHQWFYSLVGNNQAEDPWMDEALATVGESIAGDDADYYRDYDVPSAVVGHMGEPMTYWVDHGGYRRYTAGVYNQGAHTLLQARDQVGADRFDTALRSYIQSNAHRVARPTDFAHAFTGYP